MNSLRSMSPQNRKMILLVVIIIVIILVLIMIKSSQQHCSAKDSKKKPSSKFNSKDSTSNSDSSDSKDCQEHKHHHHHPPPLPPQTCDPCDACYANSNSNFPQSTHPKVERPVNLFALSDVTGLTKYDIKPYQRRNKGETGVRSIYSNKYLAESTNLADMSDEDSRPELALDLVDSSKQFKAQANLGHASNFSLTASPSTLTITPGGGPVSSTIRLISPSNTIVSIYGLNIPVGVSVTSTAKTLTSRLPSCILTFRASSQAQVQNTSVSILAFSPSGMFQINIPLNITRTSTVSSFTLSTSSNTAVVAQGSSTPVTLTLTPLSGFSGAVTFSANGLPNGVTATFNPPSSTTSTIISFSASAGAALGPKIVTLLGVSGLLTQSTTISLNVTAPLPSPTFTLTASPSSVSIIAGQFSSTVLTVTSLNGFSGSVALSVTGLPTGLTASFSPPNLNLLNTKNSSNPATTTLTLNASNLAATGSTTVVINAKSNNLTQVLNLPLVVSNSNTTPPSTTISTSQSRNWSGYVSATSLNKPLTNSCTFVTGTFTVPSLGSAVTAANNNVSIWVGIDGAFSSNPSVQQLGIDLEYVNGKTNIYAWYEMYPDYSYEIVGFPVKVGDLITTSVKVVSITANIIVYALTITNITQNESVTIPTNQTTSKVSLQQSVEWIVEAPAIGNAIVPLSQFSKITWTNCQATINGVTAPIGSFNSERINMITATGNAEANTSMLNSVGDSFTSTWID